jgi:hypothetical protein
MNVYAQLGQRAKRCENLEKRLSAGEKCHGETGIRTRDTTISGLAVPSVLLARTGCIGIAFSIAPSPLP